MSSDNTITDATVTEATETEKPLEIQIDAQTAFQLKLQEFDKNIAIAEAQVADLKKQKAVFVYDSNVQLITNAHKESLIKKQVEEETKLKLAQADSK